MLPVDSCARLTRPESTVATQLCAPNPNTTRSNKKNWKHLETNKRPSPLKTKSGAKNHQHSTQVMLKVNKSWYLSNPYYGSKQLRSFCPPPPKKKNQKKQTEAKITKQPKHQNVARATVKFHQSELPKFHLVGWNKCPIFGDSNPSGLSYSHQISVAFCSPAKSFNFSWFNTDNPLAGNKLFSPNIPWQNAPKKSHPNG